MPHVLTALFQRLAADVPLNAVIDGRIYPQPAPQGSTFPLVTYEQISSVPMHSHEPNVPTTAHRCSVIVWSETDALTEGTRDIAELIQDALIGWQQTEILNEVSRFNSEHRKRGIRQDFRIVNAR